MEMRFKFVALAALCFLSVAASRPMLRGYPVGEVTSVNRPAGIISVDLGSRDFVLKGFPFAIVDGEGRQVAKVFADEVYKDVFWSGKLAQAEFGKIRPGFQARWLFTPEIKAVVDALKRNEAGSYKSLVERFPKSAYLPQVIALMPEDMLKVINPDYYEARKSYRREDFQKVIKKYPGTGFALAAEKEIKSIDAFDADKEKAAAERAKRAAESEAEQKRRQAVDEKISQKQDTAQRREALGKLVNNSVSAVKFVFDEPSALAPVTVMPNSFMDARQQTGSYTYKVYKVEDSFNPAPDQKPQVLKEGSVDIQFDFWEVSYP
jgi:hypothetical protein